MSEISELSEEGKEFLRSYLPQTSRIGTKHDDNQGTVHDGGPEPRQTQRPFVTLTYACSLDSMISFAPGVRTALSGPETKSMTHYLRCKHDAILVGVGTAIADNPSLNCRYPGATIDLQPRPVIIDPNLRWDMSSAKVRLLASETRAKAPWIIHNHRGSIEQAGTILGYERLRVEGDGLHESSERSGEATGRMPWNSILMALGQRGIESIMIEGGATVINDLLSQPSLVDSVIITIAPTWLGTGGVVVSPPSRTANGQTVNAAQLDETKWRQFGQDAVVCGRIRR